MGAPSSCSWGECQPPRAEHRAGTSIVSVKLKEPAMPDQPIDPAATPEDPDAPEIAADDAGASAAAERASNEAANDDARADPAGAD